MNHTTLLFLISLVLASQARSAVLVKVSNVPGGVQVTANGSFNFFGASDASGFGTSGLFSSDSGNNDGIGFGDPEQNPDGENIVIGSGYLLPNFSGPASFGILADFPSDTNSGDGFFFGTAGNLLLPDTYVPGSSLNSSAQILGESISSLGLALGDNLWTWNDGVNTDSLTLSVVPEPGTAIFLSLALLGLTTRRNKV